MFSNRTDWDRSPNQLTTALRARRDKGLSVINLTESNPTRCGFDYPEAEIRAALAEPAILRYDPSPFGLLRAREAVAAHYEGRGVSVLPEQVVLTSGTSEAYSYLFRLLAGPADEILRVGRSVPLPTTSPGCRRGIR